MYALLLTHNSNSYVNCSWCFIPKNTNYYSCRRILDPDLLLKNNPEVRQPLDSSRYATQLLYYTIFINLYQDFFFIFFKGFFVKIFLVFRSNPVIQLL